MDQALLNQLIAAMVGPRTARPIQGAMPAQGAPPYVPPEVMERMEVEPRPWDTTQPAPDGRWVGIRPPETYVPGLPPGQESAPDRSPYVMRIPPGDPSDRAYHPTLRYEDAMANAQEEKLWRRQGLYPDQIAAAQEFERPKSLAEIFGPRENPHDRELMRQLLPYLGGP